MVFCTWKLCEQPGIWLPKLIFRRTKKDEPFGAVLSEKAVCDLHRDHAQLQTYLSDEGWDKISKFLRESGRGRFMKSLTELEFVPNKQSGETCLPF